MFKSRIVRVRLGAFRWIGVQSALQDLAVPQGHAPAPSLRRRVRGLRVPSGRDPKSRSLDRRAGSVIEAAFGAATASAAIWFIGWAYQKLRHREGLGFGDVKMIALMGVFLGAPNTLLAITAGSAFGAVTSLLYIHFARKDASTYQLPFGTFLGAAALAIAFLEEVTARGLLSF